MTIVEFFGTIIGLSREIEIVSAVAAVVSSNCSASATMVSKTSPRTLSFVVPPVRLAQISTLSISAAIDAPVGVFSTRTAVTRMSSPEFEVSRDVCAKTKSVTPFTIVRATGCVRSTATKAAARIVCTFALASELVRVMELPVVMPVAAVQSAGLTRIVTVSAASKSVES